MAIATERSPKYERIASMIESTLVSTSKGSKLPPIRSLMQRYNASQATIDRSLAVLIERGLLERIPDRGVFVADSVANADRIAIVELCFFYEKSVLTQNHLYSQMMSRMMTVADSRKIRLHVSAYDEMGCVDAFRKLIERSNPDAMVLMSVTRVNFELLLRSMNIPALLLLPNATNGDSNEIAIDDAAAVSAVVDYLSELGHKRIALLHGQGFHGFYHRAQAARIDQFYKSMRSHAFTVPSHFVEYGGFTPDEGYAAANKLLEASQRPTAIFCNDYNFLGVYKAATEHGLRIPHDLSVVGLDNMMPSQMAVPPLTTVDIHWKQIVDSTVSAIEELLKNHEIKNLKSLISTELVVRESTAAAP
ncbi:MAG: substrate-binding domain-containing protein [Phycisphaeraceae bacterium]|nr:substrate-binding domain-containing protein [Phycisphaeraceae bacterium]